MMSMAAARPLASYLSPSSPVAPIHGPAARRGVGGHGPAYLEPEEEGARARTVSMSRPATSRASKRTGRHILTATTNPTPPAPPASSQSTWSVRMVQGHTLVGGLGDLGGAATVRGGGGIPLGTRRSREDALRTRRRERRVARARCGSDAR